MELQAQALQDVCSLPEQNDNISQFAIKKYQFAGVRVTPVFWGKPTVDAWTRIEAGDLSIPDKSLQSTSICAAIDSELRNKREGAETKENGNVA